jgi:hypothetical protein
MQTSNNNKSFREPRKRIGAFAPHSPLQNVQRSDGCRRCGGFLVDALMDLDIGERRTRPSWAMRCVQCGDIIDETILRHRYSSNSYQEPRSKEGSRGSQSSEQEDTRAA